MTEVMENYEWNMQYFGTAQASVCTAIHQLLLQSFDGIHIFPALPASWTNVEFEESAGRRSDRFRQTCWANR